MIGAFYSHGERRWLLDALMVAQCPEVVELGSALGDGMVETAGETGM